MFTVAALDLKRAAARPDAASVGVLYNHAVRLASFLLG